MSDRDSGPSFVQSRRQFLSNTAAISAAGLLPASIALSDAASAQGASDTLVIASPATPQGLDIEFDVSLGSIDTLGAIYEYMLGYESGRSQRARRYARRYWRASRQAERSRAQGQAG